MATEDSENNNFLNELKNVLQRFGHLDPGTPPDDDDDDDDDAVAGSTCSDGDRKSKSVGTENCVSPPSPPSAEVRHRTHFRPRTPQTPLAAFRKDLSVRRSTSGNDVDDEYPPKSPPKTVFQQIPKSPQDALRRLRTGSDNSTSLESVSGGEMLHQTGSGPRRREGSEGRSRSTSSEGRGGGGSGGSGGVAKTDLYNELNTVLRRRNQQGNQSKVLDLEKMKTGKTTVYYGRGRLISSSDDGFSPSPTRVRAATIDGAGTGKTRSSTGTGNAQSSPGNTATKDSATRTPLAQTIPNATAPPPPTPPPLPAVLTDRKSGVSGSSSWEQARRGKVQSTSSPSPGENGSSRRPPVRPASISPPDRRSTCTISTTTSAVAVDSPSPQSDHHACRTPPIELDLSHPGGGTGHKVALLAVAGGATSTDDTDITGEGGGGGHWSGGSQQRVGSGDCTSDGGDCSQSGKHQQRSLGGDGENSNYGDSHNYPTLPLRPGMETQAGPISIPAGNTLEDQHGGRLPPGGIALSPAQTKHSMIAKTPSIPPTTPPSFMLETPKFSMGGGGSSSYKDLTDMSCSTSDYDYQLPFPPSAVRRAFSSDDSATSAETRVTECRRLGRKQAPKAMSWHSLMFVTGDDRWIEHYPHPVDIDGASGLGNNRTSGSGGGQRCRSYGNLMVTRADLGGAQKLFRSSGYPSSRPVTQRRRCSRGADPSLSKAYATFPPPRWTRGGVHQAGADDDLLTSLLITHSGERLPPSDTESSAHGGFMDRRRARPEMIPGGRLKSRVTIPLPTSFHMHGNHVGNNLLTTSASDDPTSGAAVLSVPEVSSPEPDYDLTPTEDEDDRHVTDSDDHTGCHVCMSLADETSDKMADTLEEGSTTLEERGKNGERDPLLLRKRQPGGATTTTDGEADGETEDSTDLDTTGNRNRKYSTTTEERLNHYREPLPPRRPLPPIDDRRSYHTWGSPTSPTTSQPDWWRLKATSRHVDNPDSSAYRARQWCRSTSDMPTCARAHGHYQSLSQDPSKEPLMVSDSYSSDDNRQLRPQHRSALLPATSGTTTTTTISKTTKNYSGGNNIQSMCTYIVDSYDHSSDADTESLCQDYDAYEKALIQYVKTEDLSQMNPDIRSLYWQQLDARSLRALRLQPRRVLHKFICCFVCDRPLKARRPVRRHPHGGGSRGPGGQGRASRRNKELPAPPDQEKGHRNENNFFLNDTIIYM